jgi:protein SCO1
MKNRTQLVSLIVICLAAAAGLIASLRLHHSSAATDLTTGSRLQPSRQLADFSLIDHQGRVFSNANLRNHWSLVFFGYTNCPDFCPATLSTLAALNKKLKNEQVKLPQVVFVSVDALRDSPEQLAKYVPYFDPSFIGLTAKSQPDIEAVARKLGVAVIITPAKDGSYTVDHSGSIFVVDPDGKLAAILTGPFTVDGLAADWRALIGGAA